MQCRRISPHPYPIRLPRRLTGLKQGCAEMLMEVGTVESV